MMATRRMETATGDKTMGGTTTAQSSTATGGTMTALGSRATGGTATVKRGTTTRQNEGNGQHDDAA